MRKFKEKYIGDRDFYVYVLGIAIPMIIQNLITNFVSMLDNIMVGQVGTAQMSGVSIVNQFMFVFNITVFGAVSGASIFGTQFYGKGDHEGQKYTFRFRLLLSIVVIAVFGVVFTTCGEQLIRLFLSSDDTPEVIEATLSYGLDYLGIMVWTTIPFAIGQAYASVVRECGETKIPMYSSAAAIGINLLLDYGLIFGKLGMPKLGVVGAAIATLVAKIIEALVVIIWAHTHEDKNKYIVGVFKGFYIPGSLAKKILIKGCPLLINEFLWSMGMSVIAQCYSVRGIDVVAARNIASTINNMFNVVFVQLGAALGIIVGARLGMGKLEEAKDIDTKLTAFNVIGATVVGLLMLPFARIFPMLYNTEDAVRDLASFFIIMQVVATPIWSYTNVCYFTLRCGGKTGITFLYDFIFTWFVQIPLAFALTNYTKMDIHELFAIVTFSEAFKCIVGYVLVKSNIWVRNIAEY